MTSISKTSGTLMRRQFLLNGKWGSLALVAACLCIWLLSNPGRFGKNASEFQLAGSLKPMLEDLSKYLTTRSASSRYAQCVGDKLRLEGSTDELNAEELKNKLEAPNAGNDDPTDTTVTGLGQTFLQATVLNAPCG
jgi:hypothetical protein